MQILITMKSSTQYKIITVEEKTLPSSYSPNTIDGDLQTLVRVRTA